MSSSESAPLLPQSTDDFPTNDSTLSKDEAAISPTRKKVKAVLESPRTGWAVIALTAIDGSFTVTDISYEFLKDPTCLCTNSCPAPPAIFDVFSFISSCITGLFVIELPFTLYAFGYSYYTSNDHALLHWFDATVIMATFIMEIVLKGREQEIISLLLILRLWRLIKLVTSVVDLTETQADFHSANTWRHWEEEKERLVQAWEREKEKIHRAWEEEKKRLEEELEGVKKRIGLSGGGGDTAKSGGGMGTEVK